MFYSLSPHLGKLYISADGKFRRRDVMVRTYVFFDSGALDPRAAVAHRLEVRLTFCFVGQGRAAAISA
ncbi:MAG TPA: hypothetical protein VKE72_01355, partial [Methylocella sp.]|nr:hypothetical protein [Methylocella sp.]